MSELSDVIRHALDRDIRAAVRGEADQYPRGRQAWIETTIGLAVNEINQWLNDPESVKAHLDEISNLNFPKSLTARLTAARSE